MKTVNVRQLKNNPSDALRMAREQPVVVMNRDQPEAVIVHLGNEGLLGEPGVRLAIATDLYRGESVSLGRGARIAGVPLAEFMRHVSQQGIPVVRSDARTVQEDVKKLSAWLKKGAKKG
jgi:predicted HTH domain antitoxin